MELESLLDVVTRLGGGRPRKRGLFSGRGNIFPLSKASRPRGGVEVLLYSFFNLGAR
jgi:hypothetical protein